MLDEQRVDRRLTGAVAKAALADVHPACARREFAQRGIGERIEQHHVGSRQQPRAAQRDQIGRARPGSDDDDAAHRAHSAQAAAFTSSAPLVRLLAGSTMINEPPTRFVAYASTGSGCCVSITTWPIALTASWCASMVSRVWMSSALSIAVMRACTQRLPWRTEYLRPITAGSVSSHASVAVNRFVSAMLPGVAIQSPRETSSCRSSVRP